MLLRTHLAISIFAILLFLPYVDAKFLFIFVALIASIIPDIDTGFSTIGRTTGTGIIRFFVKHRGAIHSFTIAIILSFLLAVVNPKLGLPFFIGYSSHLLGDSFTKEGIQAFWPVKKVSSWHIRTSSLTETSLFVIFSIIDLLLLIFLFINVF